MSKESLKRKFEEGNDVEELEWERKYIFSEEFREEMESLWEIPQIFHFLKLTKKVLNIPHLSMYEMERMLLMPKASKQLSDIMTCLLSSPNLKSKLHKIPSMPYEFWTNILMHKVRNWFKIYQNKQKNNIKVFESIGVESEFWNIFPDISYLEGKDFDELTFKQKVWLLKTVCDTILHTRKTVQEELLKQSWENKIETILGIDRYGARYIYFPQFLQNDLRVYRHCLDNRILSSVKQPIIKKEPIWDLKDENTVKCSIVKVGRNKRRKNKRRNWSNGSLPYKDRKRKEREKRRKVEKLSISPFITNDVGNLLTNESRDLSNADSFGNNNDINYESVTGRHSSSMSKTSDESYGEIKYNFNESLKRVTHPFKEFKNDYEDELNHIPIICDILEELTVKIEKNVEGLEKNTLEEISYEQSLEVNKTCMIFESKVLNDSMSNIALESDVFTNSSYCFSEENASPISTLCCENVNKNILNSEEETKDESRFMQFPNEELSKIKSVEQEETIDEDLQNDEVSLERWLYALSKRKESELRKECDERNQEDKEREYKSCKLPKKQVEVNYDIFGKDNDNLSSAESDFESSLIEWRDAIINEGSLDAFRFPGNISSEKHNYQKVKILDSEPWSMTVENFKEFMTDLSVSNFKLVADSVDTLRNFIDEFSCKENAFTKSNLGESTTPVCEVNLLRKLSTLLKSVESIETVLKDCTKKARSKLQKEWLSFKDKITTNKSSAGEDGLSSNWWVMGSHHIPENADGDYGKRSDYQEKNKEREQDESEDAHESKDMKHQSRRVLRARGISSYTEQLLSDNSETEELERWTEFEATYSVPNEQINTSSNVFSLQEKSDKRSGAEDSDQDWILPSSRSRRKKRQSASRRLKSFQHKLNKVNSSKSPPPKSPTSKSPLSKSPPPKSPSPTNTLLEVSVQKNDFSELNELETKKENRLKNSERENISTCTANITKTILNGSAEKVVPSANIICKIECADSVHSELDIKDEGPIVDTVANNYINLQQNYVVVKTEPAPVGNYYVMNQNPPITGVVQSPFMQQTAFVQNTIQQQQQQVHPPHPGYYVQSSSNYVVHGPHSGFVSPRQPMNIQQPQQMVLHQGPQIINSQQVVTHPNYVQYMVNNSQQNAVGSSLPQQRMSGVNSHRPSYINHAPPRGPAMNQHIRMSTRYPQNRMTMPRQNFTHPNGAVIRSMPIAGNGARYPGVRNVAPRNVVPRQHPRNVAPRLQRLPKPNTSPLKFNSQNTTSLIVLSDSDDDIEMIVTKDINPTPSVSSPRKNIIQPIQRRKPIVTSETVVSKPKSTLPPQIVQRMSQGGISITPVKATPPPQTNANTQLVVVVNETGSHYALALPNGSKLILTPEQVAQIRASNGGKLIL